ncbi:uncharacterized protein CTRU02_208320 [Colletotrichum truncatum]|uniref:Uncharacterized protein n=1 Tax=Colletotrichum truncatum TaxID=5467 RepID=A0ACC3YW04_COLTU|nr:uncharacterized protein CTRU02_07500 [Colletotrichum truncatum]KAF6791160.1 hypothetical protein CTRU02_07500 [Colletotrichum truncatum]
MHPQALIIALFASALSTAAAPVEESEHPTSANSTGSYEAIEQLSLDKRDSCGTRGPLFDKQSISSLKWDLQNNNPNGKAYVPRQSWFSWSICNARVCIKNSYLTENTHIKRWEAGWAVGYIQDMCCYAGGNSQWYVLFLVLLQCYS